MQFSRDVSHFHERRSPEPGTLAGYGALIATYDLKVPLPDRLALISEHHRRYDTDAWQVFTPRYTPEDSLVGHLKFALKFEGVDLYVLKSLFKRIAPQEIEAWITQEPGSGSARCVWYLYEELTKKQLNVPDLDRGNYVDLLDDKIQFTLSDGWKSKRHRVNINLLGTLDFCPHVRKTDKLMSHLDAHYDEKIIGSTGKVHRDLIRRAAAFLLLKDSKASFAIEGETPSENRAERWSRALAAAGAHPISIQELCGLQRIVMADKRFVKLGLRTESGFIGVHDRESGAPIPDHISARAEDLEDLMTSLINSYKLCLELNLNPVITAALIAFGFLFIHPFEDGNGRIHRYLFHHVLAEAGFVSKGLTFPVSAVILEHIERYRDVLEAYSRPRLDLVEWTPTPEGNVRILNETADLYRYFDATKQVEFLFDCIQETIDRVLPEEIHYLECYENLKNYINQTFEMSDNKVDLLIRFLHQNDGKLSKRALDKEFQSLTPDEISALEKKYQDIWK